MEPETIKSPINNRLQCVFVPVRDIEKAKQWYSDVLGIEGGEVVHGHLCVLHMEGTAGMVLDEMPQWRDETGDIRVHQAPVVQLSTDDIEAAYAFMKERGVQLVTDIESGHYFVFEDPDGNHLMICQC